MADQDKTEQPTEKRIRDTRSEGNVFQSRDIETVAVLLVVTLLIRATLPNIENQLRTFMRHVLTLMEGDPADMLSRQLFIEFIRTAAVCALPIA
ncbi:MAG: EscU/YscU/HrcU family type III secretion system export apparatus switch protein, partial [Lachnospiraceae bacterium]|nr:EscU/YscU/HrcU family type III secretion system export apparatus switch protein [Lachnospiraceae bacterium]